MRAPSSALDRSEPELAALSRQVTAIHKRAYGKGPVRTRTVLADDVLTIVLEGVLTRAQQTLVEAGASGQVALVRSAVHRILRPELAAAVEQHLRRTVRAATTACDPANGVETDVFLFAPARSATEIAVASASA